MGDVDFVIKVSREELVIGILEWRFVIRMGERDLSIHFTTEYIKRYVFQLHFWSFQRVLE